MVSLRVPRCDDVVFLQGLSERVRHFKLKCVATLVTSSSSASRPSPLGLGGCLSIASTARPFTYRLIYSRTRAYQTRPAVELVSGEEGLSLSRLLRPGWYDGTGSRFPEVRPGRPLVLFKRPWSLRDRGGMPRWGLMAGYAACCTTYNRYCPMFLVQRQSSELPATTVGESSRGGSLRRHKGGLWTVHLISHHQVLLQGGF